MKKDRFKIIAEAGVQGFDDSDVEMAVQKDGIRGTRRMPNARLIPMDRIVPDPDQPRKSFDEDKLNELRNSIDSQGIIESITVEFVPHPDPLPEGEGGFYRIITGHRRYYAAQMAGWTEMPCTIHNEMEKGDRFVRQLIENIQREDLSPIDKARGLLEYKKAMDWTWEDVENETGISQSRRKQIMRLLKLPEDIQAEIVSLGHGGVHDGGVVTEKHARALGRLNKQPERQRELLGLIKEKKMTGEDAIQWAVSSGQSSVDSPQAEIMVFRYEYSSKQELLEYLRQYVEKLEREIDSESGRGGEGE